MLFVGLRGSQLDQCVCVWVLVTTIGSIESSKRDAKSSTTNQAIIYMHTDIRVRVEVHLLPRIVVYVIKSHSRIQRVTKRESWSTLNRTDLLKTEDT